MKLTAQEHEEILRYAEKEAERIIEELARRLDLPVNDIDPRTFQIQEQGTMTSKITNQQVEQQIQRFVQALGEAWEPPFVWGNVKSLVKEAVRRIDQNFLLEIQFNRQRQKDGDKETEVERPADAALQ